MNPFVSPSESDDYPPRDDHLDRLHGNLLDLDESLREAVARAIGQAAAGVVRQAVLALLGQAGGGQALLRLAPRPTSRAQPLWETLDDGEETDRPPWPDEATEEEASLPDRDEDRTADPDRPARWRQLLGFALPVLGWWLHRKVGRRAVGAALACGVVCGLALYLGGRKAGSTGL